MSKHIQELGAAVVSSIANILGLSKAEIVKPAAIEPIATPAVVAEEPKLPASKVVYPVAGSFSGVGGVRAIIKGIDIA